MSGDGQPSEPSGDAPEPSWTERGRSWRRRIDAGSKLASHQVRESLHKVTDRAEESDSGLAKWSKSSAAGLSHRLDDVGGSSAGRTVARATRSVGKVVSKVPGMSALSDSVGIRHGVDILTIAVKENPKDPELLLQLALALRRKSHDMKEVRAVKAVANPMSLVTSSGMRVAAGLDADPNAIPMEEKLLRAAFKRTMAVRKVRPTDADNLHLLARIYLAQGHTETARKLARLSLAASPTYPGDVYTTLTAVEVAAGNGDRVEQYTLLADRHGSTVAHRYAADFALTTDRSSVARIREHEHHVSLIEAEHEIRYFGASLDPASREVYRRLSDQHRAKARALRDLAPHGASPGSSADGNPVAAAQPKPASDVDPATLRSLPPPTTTPLSMPLPAPPQRPTRPTAGS